MLVFSLTIEGALAVSAISTLESLLEFELLGLEGLLKAVNLLDFLPHDRL